MHNPESIDSLDLNQISIFDLLPEGSRNLAYLPKRAFSAKTWNILMRVYSRRGIDRRNLSKTQISSDLLKSTYLVEVSDVRGVGKNSLVQFVGEMRTLDWNEDYGSESQEPQSLSDYLPQNCNPNMLIASSDLSQPSWNLLQRVMSKGSSRKGDYELEFISVSSLSTISLQEVRDLVNVGELRLARLCSELNRLPLDSGPRFQQKFKQLNPAPIYYSRNESRIQLPMPLEMQMLRIVINQTNWSEVLKSDHGIDVDFLEKGKYKKLDMFIARFNDETLELIGASAGVTRERVRQILEKTFRELNDYGYFLGKRLQDLVYERSHAKTDSQVLDDIQKRLRIENLVRQELVNYPGLTVSELSESTGVAVETLENVVSKEAKKFICTNGTISSSNQSKYSNEQILDAIRRAARFDSPLTQRTYVEILESGKIDAPGPQTVAKRFGTWSNACITAGVEFKDSVRSSYEATWEDEKILKALVRFMQNRNFGRSVGQYDSWRLNVDGEAPSGAKVRIRFGTWNGARSAAFKYMRTNSIIPNLPMVVESP